jgi:hypothetical protein
VLFVARVRLDGPPEERVKQPAKPFVWGNGELLTAYVLMLVFAVIARYSSPARSQASSAIKRIKETRLFCGAEGSGFLLRCLGVSPET